MDWSALDKLAGVSSAAKGIVRMMLARSLNARLPAPGAEAPSGLARPGQHKHPGHGSAPAGA